MDKHTLRLKLNTEVQRDDASVAIGRVTPEDEEQDQSDCVVHQQLFTIRQPQWAEQVTSERL